MTKNIMDIGSNHLRNLVARISKEGHIRVLHILSNKDNPKLFRKTALNTAFCRVLPCFASKR